MPRHGRGFLFTLLYVSAGTKPGGKCGVGQLARTHHTCCVGGKSRPVVQKAAGRGTLSLARGPQKKPRHSGASVAFEETQPVVTGGGSDNYDARYRRSRHGFFGRSTNRLGRRDALTI